MDPLSDVLSMLRLRSYMSGGFDAGGDWSVSFGPPEGVKVYAAVSGTCWLAVDGVPDPVRVEPGDCFLLPRQRAFRVASDLALPPADIFALSSRLHVGGVTRVNGGGDFFCVGGHFALDGDYAGELLGALPPIVHIRDEADKAELRWCVERMRRELREPRPGGMLVAQQLATAMLVQALRLHLAEGTRGGVGWLFALADKRMAAAIGAMHADPAARWTVAALAARAGMSRANFALRFKETVGASPIEYLTRWRMMVAADRLANGSGPVSGIALSLGYESESAFGAAFRRTMGRSPRRHRRGSDAASRPHDGKDHARPEADPLQPQLERTAKAIATTRPQSA